MSKNNTVTNAKASCLCGAVEMTIAQIEKVVDACHCSMCLKWSGGPAMSVDAGSEVSINDEDNVSRFDSSEWAERAFCFQCGSHLFYRLKANNQHIVPVGLFDGIDDFEFTHQIFIDEKPDYYCFSNQTKNMTGAEVFAAYGGETE